MRCERTRSRRFVLVFTSGALGVLLWQLATADAAPLVPGIFADTSETASDSPPGSTPESSASRALVIASALPRALEAGSPSPPMTRWASWTRDAPAQAPVSTAGFSAPPPPPPREPERAPDGLPVTGMRCTQVRGALVCGDCRTDGDCPSGQGCVANRETRRFECMASECEADVHCQAGSVCRPVTTGATGSLIHRCMPEGLRGEGEGCDALPASPASACREGLRCVNQVCTTPCSPGGSTSCAPGFVCEEGLEGHGCFPDCEQRGCPEGQHCARVREGHAQCLASTQGDCRDTPCAEGERCNLRMSRGRAVFWCARVCNPLLANTCGASEVCGVGSPTVSTCFHQCDPNDPRACGTGWSCGTVTEDMSVFGCSPDLPR